MSKKNIFFILGIIIFILIVCFIFTFNSKNKSGSLVQVDYTTINKMVDKKESFILVVSQSTCSHCALYKPKLIDVSNKYNINIYYIDYDQDDNGHKFLDDFDLDGSTPTTLFIIDGKESSKLTRISGDISEDKIISNFKKMGFIK